MIVIQNYCTVFTWQNVGSEGSARVASVRLEKWLSLCQTEKVLTGFKTNPPLVKVEPNSGAGCISVMRRLRKDTKNLQGSCETEE